MTRNGPSTRRFPGRRKDARGRVYRQLDPVKIDLLNQRSMIPADTLRSMVEELLPGARRQRLVQVTCTVLSVVFVFGGTVVYFRYFSNWTGFDPVNVTIYALQVALILGGPVLAFGLARARYADRVTTVMLAHRHCPHCGYDLRGLSTDPADHATTCPECGYAWRLDPKKGRDSF